MLECRAKITEDALTTITPATCAQSSGAELGDSVALVELDGWGGGQTEDRTMVGALVSWKVLLSIPIEVITERIRRRI